MTTNSKRLLVLIVGPSGSGKSTLERDLAANYSDYYSRVISHTTRKPREGEVDGKNYHFTSKRKFVKMKKENKFLENVEFNGNLYGCSIEEIERINKNKKDAILIVEPNGLAQILKKIEKEHLPFTPLVIYMDISKKYLESNMRLRGDSEEEIQKRLNDGIKESFEEKKINPDIVVNRLYKNLYKNIQNQIFMWKKIYLKD